jgi:hypothetical protein
MRMLKCASALSARLEILRDRHRHVEAFMRVGDDEPALAGCTSLASPWLFCEERANVDP